MINVLPGDWDYMFPDFPAAAVLPTPPEEEEHPEETDAAIDPGILASLADLRQGGCDPGPGPGADGGSARRRTGDCTKYGIVLPRGINLQYDERTSQVM